MISVHRDLYPADQDERGNTRECANSAFPIYASSDGLALLEIRRGPSTSQMWRSEDNGQTWALV